MSIALVINGATFQYPEPGDINWGSQATSWASAVTTGMLQKAGGTFTLTAEVDFGASFGLKSLYYKSRTANAATAGQIRLAQADVISWRNAANSANLNLSVSTDLPFFDGNQLAYNSSLSGYQPLNSLLTAISGLGSNGIIARTSSSTSSARTITGTANRVLVTNGDGVSGNPTLDIGTDVVTLTGSQVLTNKTISGASNTLTVLAASQLSGATPIANGGSGQITANAALNAFLPTQTGNLGKVLSTDGSNTSWVNVAASGGSKNYLTTIITSNGSGAANTGNGDFELGNTTGWSLGNVTLTSGFPSGVPTFGSGASGNLAISTVTSGSQLAGNYSLSYASSAATTAGNFVASSAFFIDTEDQAKAMTISFRYKAQTNPSNANWSGTSSNSFGVAIYDVTNSAWIMPAGVWNLVQSSGVGYSTATFQTTSNSTQYRLVVFNANATSGAVTVYFDDFTFGPNSSVTAPAMSDEVLDTSLITPNATKFGTVTGAKYWKWRSGNKLFIRGEFVAGTIGGTNSTDAYLTLNGLAIDTSLTDSSLRTVVGNHWVLDASGANFGSDNRSGTMYIEAGSTSKIWFCSATTSNVLVGSVAGGNTSAYTFIVSVPIAGWSSNTVASQDTDTRVVAMNATGTATGGGSSGAIIIFPTVSFDTHAAYSPVTGRYTVPVSGIYSLSTVIGASTASITVSAYVNGSVFAAVLLTQTSTSAGAGTGSVLLNLKAGDIVDVRPNGNLGAFGSGNQLSINRLSGPAVITATESVNAKYQSAVAQSIANNSNTQTMTFATLVFDTHNAYNTSTGIYTVPVSGKYLLTANIRFTAYSASDSPQIRVYKNGTKVAAGGTIAFATSNGWFAAVSDFESCKAGDTLEFRAFQASGSAQTLDGDITENYLCISRIGN